MATKHYYSHHGLVCAAGKIQRMMLDGEMKSIHPPIIQFGRMGSSTLFQFFTDDPELQAYLDDRVKSVGDVFGPEEFNRLMIPAETRATQLAAHAAKLTNELDIKTRMIEEQNTLIQMLRTKNPAAAGKV